MADGEKETLLEQTISRLLEFQGMEVTSNEGSGQTSAAPVLRAPGLEHLDFGNNSAQVVEETADTLETTWEQSIEDMNNGLYEPRVRRRRRSARQRTMAMLVPVLSVVLLIVLNKFHGVNFLGSEWLHLGTYRTMVSDILQSGPSVTIDDETPRPVRLKVRGIAFSSDRPSAVIGTTIVHEGDIVLGALVVRIGRDGVEFEVNGERWIQKVQ